MTMAAAEYAWPRRSSISRPPDTLSPVYPDRPIRPLPKNRLREQLSPEQQSQIIYPPEAPSTSPLFSFPYGVVEKIDPRALNHDESHSHCTCNGDEHVDESEDDEELIAYDHPSYRWSSPVNDGSRVDSVQRKLTAAKAPPAPPSTASSADGYESFENTSNKKKRKIPLSGGGSLHQSSLSQELANMGISSREEHQQDTRQLSGSGRGRFGRGHQAYASSLSAKSRGGNWKGDGTRTSKKRCPESQDDVAQTLTHCTEQENGIISQAIANAQHDQDQDADQQAPTTPTKQNSETLSATTTPPTQFTFTCESDSSNKLLWPQQPTPFPNSMPRSPLANHSTSRVQQPQPPTHSKPPPPAQNNQPQQQQQPQARKPRQRRPTKEFALQERQRRLQQEYTNYHSRPTPASMWICEFCEYEDIWGVRPEALIRQYEIKDRKERLKAEERRRLLEKAKQKNRKGKKNNNTKGKPAPPQHYQDENAGPHLGQEEEEEEAEFDDGYEEPAPVDARDCVYAADDAYDRPPKAPDKELYPQQQPQPLQQRRQ
ncbi:hypothetical protein E4T39_01467 [Aureobasidium subglaciale]|nr:hypothetical protein E4T39_01467 [Aureobasidium subglaciale]